ncbi:MAG: hypothetical protein WBL67_13430 [Nitrososphaeraceae archaeon]
MIIGGFAAVLIGAFLFKDYFAGICTKIPIPLLCPSPEEHAEMLTHFGPPRGKVPWSGGAQMTETGPRHLAGPDDLPPAY